jgi:hypothetical protein
MSAPAAFAQTQDVKWSVAFAAANSGKTIVNIDLSDNPALYKYTNVLAIVEYKNASGVSLKIDTLKFTSALSNELIGGRRYKKTFVNHSTAHTVVGKKLLYVQSIIGTTHIPQ